MRSAEERIARMHERAAVIKKQEEKSGLRILGSLSAVLLVCVGVAMQLLQSMHHAIYTGRAAGTSLLDESAGGYVLAAVIAFFAGVAITAMVYRYRNRMK